VREFESAAGFSWLSGCVCVRLLAFISNYLPPQLHQPAKPHPERISIIVAACVLLAGCSMQERLTDESSQATETRNASHLP